MDASDLAHHQRMLKIIDRVIFRTSATFISADGSRERLIEQDMIWERGSEPPTLAEAEDAITEELWLQASALGFDDDSEVIDVDTVEL